MRRAINNLRQLVLVMGVLVSISVGLIEVDDNNKRGLQGVAPADLERYTTAIEQGTFECGVLNKKTISAFAINDDYCDCPEDGSDEPGTSACPNSKFFCHNRLYKPETLPASRINDGYCDCCDGSDEWKQVGGKPCENTCREKGADLRMRTHEMYDTVKRGVELRKAEAEKAVAELEQQRKTMEEMKVRLAGEEAELAKLEEKEKQVQAEEDELQAQLAIKRAAEEEANKRNETAATEQSQQQMQAEQGQEKKEGEQIATEQEPLMEPTPTMEEARRSVGMQTIPHMKHEPAIPTPPSEDAELPPQQQQEEETIEPEQPQEDPAELKEKKEGKTTTPPIPNQQDEFEDAEEEEEEGEEVGVWGGLGKVGRSFSRGFKKIGEIITNSKTPHKHHRHQTPTQDTYTPSVTPATQKAREETAAARNKRDDTKRNIEAIEKELEMDFGPDKCFHTLYHKCYSTKKDQYNYELCLFDRASQKEGASSVDLGSWGKWEGEGENSKTTMVYENGLRCWNGPDRSIKATVLCGVENKIEEASEPARCEYAIKFYTPCACQQSKLDALAAQIKEFELADS